MTPADVTLLAYWRELSPSTRQSYRDGWRAWCAYCAAVNLEPTRASVEQGQAWVESMRHRKLADRTIRRLVLGAKMSLEYLAMLGHQPHEPFHHVVLPRHVRRGPVKPAHAHEALTGERIASALYDSRLDPRAHTLLWLAAGMGLGPSDIAALDDDRIKHLGDQSVAVVPRGGRAHLVPVPREILVCCAVNDQWPCRTKNGDTARTMAARVLTPYISTSLKELRDWHRVCAVALGCDPDRVEAGMNDSTSHGMTRWQWGTHPAIVVCAELRKLLLDRIGQ